MTLLFDLDGVLRNLHFWCPDIAEWTQKFNGLSFCDTVDRDLSILETAPPTEYYPVVKDLPNLVILTHQPPKWYRGTTRWCKRYLPQASVVFVDEAWHKMMFLGDETLLIEDSPVLPDYSRIILIDRPYNQAVTGCYERVSIPVRLGEIIDQYA